MFGCGVGGQVLAEGGPVFDGCRWHKAFSKSVLSLGFILIKWGGGRHGRGCTSPECPGFGWFKCLMVGERRGG